MKTSTIIAIVTGSEKRGQSGISVFRRSKQVFVFDQSKKKIVMASKVQIFFMT